MPFVCTISPLSEFPASMNIAHVGNELWQLRLAYLDGTTLGNNSMNDLAIATRSMAESFGKLSESNA